ncbi:autotransporter outer membrane beta-barrel domain-containing protein [Pseudomonas aegrilactucae]|uniref:Autotransporter outer membrane beta-barrel domain-containing protein n=1 Tax=Pseudomonas aegrilactucae TaxID=2854028 RepID=A0A9Q2XHB5_9PSED|nr:autotransporter outer membrane beta-barrel domain-containing protein [Pseudomonas aegrilactucae]MBV6286154.1 autotransporter outer membrane beta-barrel domain-containing protein [Pseudomonas aegrilactucae]
MSAAWRVLLAGVPLLGPLSMLSTAQAACLFGPDSGNDRYVCSSGNAPALTDLNGNNSLLMPADGTGTIVGNVIFGAGADHVEIASGTIGGVVDQGAGVDTFIMSGGQIQALQQGNSRDLFDMSGGRIVGAFEDGDVARMSGGRIGRVDMKLDNNLFDMSGGVIDGNLVAGFGKDTALLSGGRIGGNVSLSGGDDRITLTGTEVLGNVLLSFGNDQLVWREGGIVYGTVQMGEGDDQALLVNLDEHRLGLTRQLDAGLGTDSLLLDNTRTSVGARYVGWEHVTLRSASAFTLDDTLVLGDVGTRTGTLQIDAGSQLISRSGQVTAVTSGQQVTVKNAGVIDLGSGADAQGQLALNGHYVGNNAVLRLNSVLAGDGAASDRLVIHQGTLEGATRLDITNLGGRGATTSANGIEVVRAAAGTTSSATAFSLGQPLSAGPYQYYLFKGGVTADSENSWYLRSSVVAAPPPGQPAPSVPVAAPGTPLLPGATAGHPIVLYRAEVPVYATASRAAALITRTSLATFHQRQGEQTLLKEDGAVAAGWGRTFGEHVRRHWSGTVSPSLAGNLSGFQVGHDLYARRTDSGYRQHVGVSISHTRLSGAVKGFALGFVDTAVGDIKLDGDSVGAYWTLMAPQQWYLDTVLQYTDLQGRARSERGVKLDLNGHALAASVETGYPLALRDRWVIEPQLQLIAQNVEFDTRSDGISRVSQRSQTQWTGRLGARVRGHYMAGGVALQPVVRSNLWRSFGGHDTLAFDSINPISTDQAGTWMEIGAGLSAQLSPAVAVYAGANYSANLDSRQQASVGGTLGLRVSW